MKNETNTQHTPYLAFDPQFEDENFQHSAIVDNPSEHAEKTEEATAGNIAYRYIPLPHVVRCVNEYDKLKALNAELLEALKDVRDFFQTYVPLVDHNGKSLEEDWDWEIIDSAIAKAESKTLGVS